MALRQKLLEEDLEITAATAGAAPVQLPDRVISIFPAFAHRNFQLYFFGQSISVIGFWLHQVGLGFYVFQLTHSAFWVGVAAASLGLPIFFISTFAGVFIERLNKQVVLFYTQIADSILAIILGIAVIGGQASLSLVMIMVFASGVVGAIDLPTRLSFVVEMVGKRDLASAIPINNGVFNAARFIGPAIAGLLIATVGVGWTFIINGLSYLPAVAALLYIRPVYKYAQEANTHPLESLKIGVRYSFSHPKIFYFLLLSAATALFIWPYAILMPVIAQKVFSVGPQGLGSLLSAAGAGSMAGAIYTSAQARRENKGKIVVAGLLISTIALILFAFNHNFTFAHILLFFAGFGALAKVSTINTLVQIASPDHMRSRIMGVYLTMFVGMMPFGSFLAGTLAEKTSSMFTIGLNASIVLILGIILYFRGVFSNFH